MADGPGQADRDGEIQDMIPIETEIGGVPVHIERYMGTEELLHRLRTPCCPDAPPGYDFLNGDPPRNPYTYNFADGRELVARMRCGVEGDPGSMGWDLPVRTGEVDRLARRVVDVAGGAVVVPRLVADEPRCMMSVRRRRIQSRILRLCVDVSMNYRYSAEQYRAAGIEVLRAIRALEAAGYTVVLTIAYTTLMRPDSGGEYEIYAMSVPFKGTGEPLNVRRCLYPLSDVSYMRGVGFCWSVHMDGFTDRGMGTDFDLAWPERDRAACSEELYRRLLGPDWLVIRSLDLVERSLDDPEDMHRWIATRLLRTVLRSRGNGCQWGVRLNRINLSQKGETTA